MIAYINAKVNTGVSGTYTPVLQGFRAILWIVLYLIKLNIYRNI